MKNIHRLKPGTNLKILNIDDLVSKSDIIFVPIQTPHNKKYEGINDIPKTRRDFNYNYLVKFYTSNI